MTSRVVALGVSFDYQMGSVDGKPTGLVEIPVECPSHRIVVVQDFSPAFRWWSLS